MPFDKCFNAHTIFAELFDARPFFDEILQKKTKKTRQIATSNFIKLTVMTRFNLHSL